MNRRDDATERLLDFAENVKGGPKTNEKEVQEWRLGTVQERITHSLVKGVDAFIEVDVEEAQSSSHKTYRSYRNQPDDRNECRWRFVWFRKNVFATGGKISKGNEKSRSVFVAIH